MKEISSAHPAPPIQRDCHVGDGHLHLLLLIVALVLCIAALAYARGSESTYPVQVDSGWNLLSLPASVSNGSKEFLFPSASSSAFAFHDPTGYEQLDTLHNGVGFWLKFNSSETVSITGELIFKDTVEVHAGWNIVGSLSVPIAVDSIKTEPPGMITSVFFGFRPGVGYEEADTLYPGFGYWIKVNHVGSIILSSGSGPPCPGIPTVLYSGKTYNTVLIGSQCWLKENLEVGTMILAGQPLTNNGVVEKYCYGDDTVNCDTYGGLYQWNEAMQYDSVQGGKGVCPVGWHIPTLAEFQRLMSTVSGDGNALKAIGQGGSATNTSGFSALLAGDCWGGTGFEGLGDWTYLWASMRLNNEPALFLCMISDDGTLYIGDSWVSDGFSVRCIRSDTTNQPPYWPSTPGPDNGAVNVVTPVTLSWTCGDPEGDPLTYSVYLGTFDPPTTAVSSNQADTSLTPVGLAAGTVYFWKVVAKDAHGDSMSGPVWRFTTLTDGGTPCPGTPTVSHGGRIYNTVRVGTQCWLKENLDIGAMINGNSDQTNNGILEKYCYNNDTLNCTLYGGLYQWNEAMGYDTSQGSQGVCPPGWHMPSWVEFDTLRAAVGSDGNALLAIGQGGLATNTSGFSALLAGYCAGSGGFQYLWWNGAFWSSTQYAYDPAAGIYLFLDRDGGINMFVFDKHDGLSIRCIKD